MNLSPNFQELFEAAPGLYLVLSPDLTIVAVSNNYLRATMTQREAILGRGIFEVFPDNPDDKSATGAGNLRASLERVVSTRAPDAMAVQKYDIRRPETEGGGFEERFWSPVNSPVLGPDKALHYIIHRVEDVTEFVRVQRAGAERERLNEELRTRAGAMEVEVFQRAQDLQETNKRIRAAQEALAAANSDLERRVELRTRDLVLANEALRGEIEMRERTEAALQKTEEQLRQSQKLEAIGQLAGGVAHDFNNLLSVVLSYSALLIEGMAPDDPRRVDLEEIHSAGQRAAGLTRQLLAFSRQQVLAPRRVQLSQIIQGMDRLFRRVIGEDIELVTLRTDDLGTVRVDPGQVEQVLLNLVINARDAMPSGGKLIVETRNVFLDQTYASSHENVVPGPHVMLAVSDTGVGMDKATQARIFEPFFTTKEQGKGTGLGLSTVFGIVKQSGGHVWVYSEPGQGTTFKVYFPCVDGPSEALSAAPVAAAPVKASETILLVEDEDAVRRVVQSILSRAGYTLLVARGGEEALAHCAQHPGPIHLLVTDVIMPNRSGREVAEQVRRRLPSTKVLYVSGYTDDAVVRSGVLGEGMAFLQKPIIPEALLAKVRSVLDSQ